jgi:hypothetical protein
MDIASIFVKTYPSSTIAKTLLAIISDSPPHQSQPRNILLYRL